MTLSKDIDELLLQRILGMLEHTQLKQHDNTAASMDVQLHATNKQNNLTLPRDIVALLCGECWTYSVMPDQTHQILQD